MPWRADPAFVAASRRRDLLYTLVTVAIALTPAWLTPWWFALPWAVVVGLLGVPLVAISWRYAPWWPTPADEVQRIVGHLALDASKSFCDLGAGDGRMVLRVQAATGAHCSGIELSPFHYLLARIRIAVAGTDRTRVILGNLYRTDLSRFDAVYVWGTAYFVATPHFAAHMRASLKPGARLVSYHYPLHGLEPVEVDERGQRPIYVYVFSPVRQPGDPGEQELGRAPSGANRSPSSI